MIVRLTGTLIEVAEDRVVIERAGLGYETLIPAYVLPILTPCIGRQVTVHTIEYLEGNSGGGHFYPVLIGFPEPIDRDFFERFTSVKGIGPRKALKALAFPIGRVASWIEGADAKALKALPGIGARTAEMIVAELSGKMREFVLSAGGDKAPSPEQWTAAQRDALSLVVSWGDTQYDAERWLGRAAELHPDLNSVEDWVRAVYRLKAGNER